MSLTSHLFLVSFNFPLCFRLQLNVICSINFLRDNSHLIFYWQLKIMIESPHYLAQGLQNEHNQCNEEINDKNKALSCNIQFVVSCRKRSNVSLLSEIFVSRVGWKVRITLVYPNIKQIIMNRTYGLPYNVEEFPWSFWVSSGEFGHHRTAINFVNHRVLIQPVST